MITKQRRASRDVRHLRLRSRLRGSASRPRLAVFRSLKHIYAQLIDDDAGATLLSVDSRGTTFGERWKTMPRPAAAAAAGAAPSGDSAPAGGAPAAGDGAGRIGTAGNVAAAKLVGELLAAAARGRGIERVVFDRGGYRYHGRVKALADAARAGGLAF
jgi:large subunit ribosomal protein L18